MSDDFVPDAIEDAQKQAQWSSDLQDQIRARDEEPLEFVGQADVVEAIGQLETTLAARLDVIAEELRRINDKTPGPHDAGGPQPSP